ncbi:FxSxx-COOH system tetratricopeptide repeat protein [Streptomyces sp. NPDC004752]
MSDDFQQPSGGTAGDHLDFRGSVFTGPVLGRGEQHIHYGPPRSTATWPHQVGAIPATAGCFQHRAEAARLREALTGGEDAVLVGQDTVHGRVLTGMGGVGKTQLAADYARTAWQTGRLDVLIWITASSSSAVVTGYAQAAVEVLGADPADPEAAAQVFVAWLEPKPQAEPCRWLIVLDDVTDPDDLRGWWPPAGPHGRTLVTTRRQDAALTGHGRRLISVGLFTEAESLAYLTAALATHDRQEPDGHLAALAEDLGQLPLALSQAAAYLIDTGISVSAYRSLLADRTRTLADAVPEALPDGQAHSMAAAWALSIDRADTLRPAGLARPLLRLAAFLDPNGIPETVLTSEPVLAHLTPAAPDDAGPPPPRRRAHQGLGRALWRRGGGRSAPATAEPVTTEPVTAVSVTAEQVQLALSALRRLSLIDRGTPGGPHPTVRIHQLIQHAVRDTLAPDQHDALARTAADALLAAWPDIARDTALAQALRANTAAVARSAEQALHRPGVHQVLYRAGVSLGETGQVTAARDYFHRLADTLTAHLGPDHPDTLGACGSRALWRGRAGDAAGAVSALTDLLPRMVRAVGEDHPHPLIARYVLAHLLGEMGDKAGAAAAFADLLPHMVRVLGRDHPDTLAARHCLADWRGGAGDTAGAATAFADLVTDRTRVLGEDHPDTLSARHTLANWRGRAGDAAGALSALTELLPHMVRVLGADHPDTLNTRFGLTVWRAETGDAVGAATALADLVTDRTRVLGEDHPHTLTTRYALARLRGGTGDAVGAATALADLVTDRTRVLGEDHPDTLDTRMSLAVWRAETGDAAGAAAAFADLLPHMVRMLGEDHPETLATRHGLAVWRAAAGDAAGATSALTDLLPCMVRVLGEDHPRTRSARHNLAYLRQQAGGDDGAAG